MAVQGGPTVPKEGSSYLTTWNLLDGDSGDPVSIPGAADKTVTITGTFDGNTVTMQGSNDKTVWHSLTDAQGNAIAFTAAGMEIITENPLWIRPLDDGTGTSQDTVIDLLCRSTMKGS